MRKMAQPGKSGKKRLKVTLIYPPANYKNSETFPFMNMSIAVLAGSLIREGHAAVQADIEKQWFQRIKDLLAPRQLSLINDYDAVLAYVNGRAAKRRAAEFAAITDLLIKECGLGESDLFGITFIDMKAEPLMLNFSALLAFGLKARFGAPVVVGSRRIPPEAFMYIMKRYPCFDYAVYADWGEKALSEIINAVSGKKAEFIDTIVRTGAELETYHNGLKRPVVPTPHYEKEVIDRYRVDDSEIFSRYNSGYPFIKELLREKGERLVAPYAFELYCPGACAFCENDNSLPSDAKSPDQVIDELFALKEKGFTGVYFVNSAFNNNYKRAEELCDKMIKYRLGLQWADCANFRTIDENLLDKMRAAGAIKLTYGMETASPRLLKYIQKGSTIEKIRRYLEYSDSIGIWNHLELIGGLPTETPADIEATRKFIEETGDIVEVYSLNPFYLYRNSMFYREAKKFGLAIRPAPAPEAVDYFARPGNKIGEFSEKFDETGGLKWEEKDLQISKSTETLAEAIGRVSSYRAIEWEHIYLLMALYARLGHERKDLIRKLMNILTVKFKPYNLDFFFGKFEFKKHRIHRELESFR